MADNGHNGNGHQAPSTTLVLTITFDQLTGQVGVAGPIQNPLICYGMIECAKNAIAELAKQSQSRIVPATAGPRMVT
jgi:hypothetical protein